MLRGILLALSYSPACQSAVRVAAELAVKLQTRLHVIVPPLPIPLSGINTYTYVSQECIQWCEEDEYTLLKETFFTIQSVGADIASSFFCEKEPYVHDILHACQQCACDLIIFGECSLTGLAKLKEALYAPRLLQKATCPVLLLRDSEPTWPPRQIFIEENTCASTSPPGHFVLLLKRLYDTGDCISTVTSAYNARYTMITASYHKARLLQRWRSTPRLRRLLSTTSGPLLMFPCQKCLC